MKTITITDAEAMTIMEFMESIDDKVFLEKTHYNDGVDILKKSEEIWRKLHNFVYT